MGEAEKGEDRDARGVSLGRVLLQGRLGNLNLARLLIFHFLSPTEASEPANKKDTCAAASHNTFFIVLIVHPCSGFLGPSSGSPSKSNFAAANSNNSDAKKTLSAHFTGRISS